MNSEAWSDMQGTKTVTSSAYVRLPWRAHTQTNTYFDDNAYRRSKPSHRQSQANQLKTHKQVGLRQSDTQMDAEH